jgi:hypothetical protein
MDPLLEQPVKEDEARAALRPPRPPADASRF